MGSTSPRSKTTPDLQNDNNPRKIPLERCDCERKKYTGDDQGRAEVNHTSLGAGQVKNRILCLLEKKLYRLVEGKCFQVSDSPTKDKVG